MSASKCDYIKLVVLALALGACFYSALTRFAFVPAPATIHLKPDLSLCRMDREDLKAQCRVELREGFQEAEVKCKGYLKNLATCKSSQVSHQSQCRVENTNVEGCTHAVLDKLLAKWSHPPKL
jgi:hypothetical protein